MSRVYDRPILLQRINETTEKWEDLYRLHARVNKARDDSESLEAGAIRAKRVLSFEIRYFADLKEISLNTQLYRVIYDGTPYNVTAYDDYLESHKTVKLVGESY